MPMNKSVKGKTFPIPGKNNFFLADGLRCWRLQPCCLQPFFPPLPFATKGSPPVGWERIEERGLQILSFLWIERRLIGRMNSPLFWKGVTIKVELFPLTCEAVALFQEKEVWSSDRVHRPGFKFPDSFRLHDSSVDIFFRSWKFPSLKSPDVGPVCVSHCIRHNLSSKDFRNNHWRSSSLQSQPKPPSYRPISVSGYTEVFSCRKSFHRFSSPK